MNGRSSLPEIRVLAPALLLALAALIACTPDERGPSEDATPAGSETDLTPPDPATLPPQASSLLGDELSAVPLSADSLAERQTKWREAERAYADDPSSVERAIWLGRRTAYLGDYRQAIALYSAAMRQHPDDARLYRHRGHRYLTVRELDRAIADFEKAAELIEGEADVVEPDGLPNAAGIPTSTLQSNIWYHLGLAHFARGELEQAETAYRAGLGVSDNPDMLSAMTYWAYLTARALDRAAADTLLGPIDPGMEIIENTAYHRLLLLYGSSGEQAVRLEAELVDQAGEPGSVAFATIGFGLSRWLLWQGRDDEAGQWLEGIVAAGQWPAFGHLAAEAELAADR